MKYNLQEAFNEEGEASENGTGQSNAPVYDSTQSQSNPKSTGPGLKKSKKYENAQSSSKTKSFLAEMKKKAKKDNAAMQEVIIELPKNLDEANHSKLADSISIEGSKSGTAVNSEGVHLNTNESIKGIEEVDEVRSGEIIRRKRSQSLNKDLFPLHKHNSEEITDHSEKGTKSINHLTQSGYEKEPQNKLATLIEAHSYNASPIEERPAQSRVIPLKEQQQFIPPPPNIAELQYIMSVPDPEYGKGGNPNISSALLEKVMNNQKETSKASVGIQASPIPLHAAPKKKRPVKIEERLNEVVNSDEEAVKQTYLEEGPMVYQLVGILIHRGGAYGGHYYAYIRSFEDFEWYCFDDIRVFKVSKEAVADDSFGGKGTSANGYMFFYQIVEDILPPENWLKIPKELKETCLKEIEQEKIESSRGLL